MHDTFHYTAVNTSRRGPPKICSIDVITSCTNNDAMLKFCQYDAVHKVKHDFSGYFKAR